MILSLLQIPPSCRRSDYRKHAGNAGLKEHTNTGQQHETRVESGEPSGADGCKEQHQGSVHCVHVRGMLPVNGVDEQGRPEHVLVQLPNATRLMPDDLYCHTSRVSPTD